jgi:hypothetical protein
LVCYIYPFGIRLMPVVFKVKFLLATFCTFVN